MKLLEIKLVFKVCSQIPELIQPQAVSGFLFSPLSMTSAFGDDFLLPNHGFFR